MASSGRPVWTELQESTACEEDEAVASVEIEDELMLATTQYAWALSTHVGPVAPDLPTLPSSAPSSRQIPVQPMAPSPCVVSDAGAAPASNDTLLSSLLLPGPPPQPDSTGAQPLLRWHQGKLCVTIVPKRPPSWLENPAMAHVQNTQ